jgi:hypothetical protein
MNSQYKVPDLKCVSEPSSFDFVEILIVLTSYLHDGNLINTDNKVGW